MSGPIRRTAADRVLVAGDAGGFVNGYTAEGIYYAMVTGELAAKAILADAAYDDPRRGLTAGERYEDAWRREIGAELRDSLLIQRYLFRDPSRIDGVVRNAEACREVADLIIAYASGTVPYAAARRRILARFPRVIWRLARVARSG